MRASESESGPLQRLANPNFSCEATKRGSSLHLLLKLDDALHLAGKVCSELLWPKEASMAVEATSTGSYPADCGGSMIGILAS